MNSKTGKETKLSLTSSHLKHLEARKLQLHIENELLLNALHSTQEELEITQKNLDTAAEEVKQLIYKLGQLYEKFPGYWDAGSIECNLIEAESATRISWCISDTTLKNRHHKKIVFETILENNSTRIEILNESENFDVFKAQPNLHSINLNLTAGSLNHGTNNLLNDLGTTDWQSLKLLIKKVQQYLLGVSPTDLPKKLALETADGLQKTSDILDSWPHVLRYDFASITEHSKSNNYSHLEINLKNLEFGSKFAENFCYRFSSVSEPDQAFGQFPRLEFYEDTIRFFESWFCESFDIKGRRLELRFAKAGQMDVTVWNKLSNGDKIFVAAIISKMHSILEFTLPIKDHGQEKIDWIGASQVIRQILKSTLFSSAKLIKEKI